MTQVTGPVGTSQPASNFDFGTALAYLKNGYSVSRDGWNNSNISVHMQTPDENSKMTEPYLYMEKVIFLGKAVHRVKRFPLDLSCESILAEDWTLL